VIPGSVGPLDGVKTRRERLGCAPGTHHARRGTPQVSVTRTVAGEGVRPASSRSYMTVPLTCLETCMNEMRCKLCWLMMYIRLPLNPKTLHAKLKDQQPVRRNATILSDMLNYFCRSMLQFPDRAGVTLVMHAPLPVVLRRHQHSPCFALP
jgi:hypothetical protein